MFLFSGCSTPKTRIVFEPVEVPVPVYCDIDIPNRPELALKNTVGFDPNDEIHSSLISKSYVISIFQLISYTEQLESLIAACTESETTK